MRHEVVGAAGSEHASSGAGLNVPVISIVLKEQQGDIDQVEIGAREAREVAEKAGEDIEKAKSYGGGGCSAM